MNSRLFRFDFDRTHFGDHGLESSTISCPADTLYSALCVEALGTETPRGWRMRCARKCRQTQNPERGRKLRRLGRHRVC